MLRQVICVALGHVDHGKTSLLDKIRDTKVQSREAGAITQAIGASEIPKEVVDELSGPILKKFNVSLSVPGLLVVDTPGHESFTNLRKRGGSIADIAILVVDITQGVQNQTIEAMEILREYKTPFIVAANKVDLIRGWDSDSKKFFTASLDSQSPEVRSRYDEKLYELVGQLYSHGFSADAYYNVSDFTKQVAIVPVSAKTGEGVPEILAFVSGLTQKFLEKRLEVDSSAPGKLTILEVREEKGLGKTIDAILYDGTLSQNDSILFASFGGICSSRVKAILRLKPLDEMRDPRHKFLQVKSVFPAAGIKIVCDGAGDAIPGSSLFVFRSPEEEAALRGEIEGELRSILVESERNGVIVRADTLGSLEAIVKLFDAEKIVVRKALIGSPVSQDLVEAQSVFEKDPYLGVIFAFNVRVSEDFLREAELAKVKVFSESVIYNLAGSYKDWRDKKKAEEKKRLLESIVLPAKMQVLHGCCFRNCNPCIVGCRVLEGTMKPGYSLISADGSSVGEVKGIEDKGESLKEAKKNDEFAFSIVGPTFGKSFGFNDVLYADLDKRSIKLLEGKYRELLTPEQLELLAVIKKIKGIAPVSFG